jgi:outer membrane protein OmpA-like peptidoglycan-associated protein
MRSSIAALLASFAILIPGAASALAQVATGNEISVNPMTPAGKTLLYPGGQYSRVVRPLLQPGQTDSGVITLHMPDKNTRRATVAARPAARRKVAVAAPTPAPKAAPAPKVAAAPTAKPAPVQKAAQKPAQRVASTPPPAPASANGYNPGYGSFGAPGAAGAAGLLNSMPPAPAASPAPPPAKPQQQLAKANPVPPPASPAGAVDPNAPGLTKRSVILFAVGASDPAASALDAIKLLAGDLNSAMTKTSSRVQLMAYGGVGGDKSSDARRLSLKRALAIRQVLIDDGVPSERIDVRAMGGVDDGGPLDRVDVYVKA